MGGEGRGRGIDWHRFGSTRLGLDRKRESFDLGVFSSHKTLTNIKAEMDLKGDKRGGE
jgi:hypothetical protein